MARFICALHAPNSIPRAYALLEVMTNGLDPVYAVRDLRTVAGDDATNSVLQAVLSEPQYAGRTRFVSTGGQKAVDALHEHGPSAAAVTLIGENSANMDAQDVSLQVLVDTFERLYRAGAVQVPGAVDAASAAIDAMYSAADLEAAAPDSDRDASGNLDGDVSETLSGARVMGGGPRAIAIEQSGSARALSTEVIENPITMADATAAAVDSRVRHARTASFTGAAAPDLGNAADTAIALALGCWFGETSRDELPQTDKADEANEARQNAA